MRRSHWDSGLRLLLRVGQERALHISTFVSVYLRNENSEEERIITVFARRSFHCRVADTRFATKIVEIVGWE
ncbi:MAG: hypothetical protein MI923_01200 [Phycisphaerales bacterium]|nr:hypothetical protein [Phycisphaerales bacterium]